MAFSENKTGDSSAPGHAFRLARSVSRKLGHVPSMLWAAIYLCCIPGFAIIYTVLPQGSWYYSTILHEARYQNDKKTFAHLIELWAKAEVEPRLYRAIEKVGVARPKEISYYADYDEKDFWPTLLISLRYPDTKDWISLQFYMGEMLHFQVTKDVRTSPPTITTEKSDGYNLVADCERSGMVSECLATKIQAAFEPDNYFIGWRGIVEGRDRLLTERSGVSTGRTLDTLARMLYLSTVTITTVGYGDIVPLTDVARLAAGLEAIIGIVLIGLFLNAIAYERQS